VQQVCRDGLQCGFCAPGQTWRSSLLQERRRPPSTTYEGRAGNLPLRLRTLRPHNAAVLKGTIMICNDVALDGVELEPPSPRP
jgi:aerobic-type carbon monoxide dehydrogenase small subunit (CoxS/CutS family)